MKKIFKCKNLFLVTFLAIAGFFSAAAIIANNQIKQTRSVEKADAATYELPTSNGKLYLYFYHNNQWHDASAKIFVYFYNATTNCWMTEHANQDKYKVASMSGTNHTVYECTPSNKSQEWTGCIFVRKDPNGTSGNWDYKWAQSPDISFSNHYNMYAPWQGNNNYQGYDSFDSAYDIRSSDGNLVYIADWKANNWTSNEAKIWGYFFNHNGTNGSNGENCWSPSYINQDFYKYYDDKSDDKNETAYFFYPSNTSIKYSHCILVRFPSGQTSTPSSINDRWDKTGDIAIGDGYNQYKPTNTGRDSAPYDSGNAGNILTETRASGDTVFIRDKNNIGTDDADVQIHLYGSTTMQSEQYFNVTGKWIQGTYDNGNNVEGLLEVVIPGSGRWRWFQLKRLQKNTSNVWGTADPKGFTASNDVYETTGYTDGKIYGGFSWNVSSEQRVNIFARYVVSETGKVCTDNPSQSDLSPALEAHWGYTKTQYGYMSTANQGTFYVATPGTSDDLQKGALRYDRLVYLYGKNKDTGARIGTRSGRLEDYVNRHANSDVYYYGSIRSFSPIELIVGTDKEADTTVILIIVMSSISILSITALSVLMIKKRKSKEQ